MKRKAIFKLVMVVIFLITWAIMPGSVVSAQDVLKYSCSNQVFSAFEMEKIKAFIEATGIKVDVYTASSGSSMYRLINGYSDIASIARKLYRRHADYGYKETPFCKDPIGVIAKVGCGVDNVSEKELQDIFSGDITNWKELGGADLPITIIVPGKDTAASKNFRRQVMKHKEIKFDFMTYESTMAIEAVKYFPCGSISFISGGAAIHHKAIKTIKVNDYSPKDKSYPYYQIFYYVTKGEPVGYVKKFIDFTFSKKGAEIIKKNGMLPVSR